jgi:hypothetical protein
VAHQEYVFNDPETSFGLFWLLPLKPSPDLSERSRGVLAARSLRVDSGHGPKRWRRDAEGGIQRIGSDLNFGRSISEWPSQLHERHADLIGDKELCPIIPQTTHEQSSSDMYVRTSTDTVYCVYMLLASYSVAVRLRCHLGSFAAPATQIATRFPQFCAAYLPFSLSRIGIVHEGSGWLHEGPVR